MKTKKHSHCRCCDRPFVPSYDAIEKLLVDGVPKLPESRATKEELLREVHHLRDLLSDLRTVFLLTVANEMHVRSNLTHEGQHYAGGKQ